MIDFVKSQANVDWTIDGFNDGPCFLYNQSFLEIKYSDILDGQLRDAYVDFNLKR